MPKRILGLSLAVAAIILAAACSSGSGVSVPTPTPTLSATPIPTASSAVVTVFASATPAAGIPVALSTPDSNGRPGAPIVTQTTGPTGTTTFINLTPATIYCFTATYTPAGGLTQVQTQTPCNQYWGYGVSFTF